MYRESGARADSVGMEIQGLNPELTDMALAGQLSGRKIAGLIRLKECVDRYAQTKYVPDEQMQQLIEKYGVEPDIVSWGDYFQTEIASRHFQANDAEFEAIVETVRFDLISAVKIFGNKSNEYKTRVEREGLETYGMPQENWGEPEEEKAHLYILLQYFRELGLEQAEIPAEEEAWFEGFVHGHGGRSQQANAG